MHGELTRLAKARAGHDAEEAHWLVEGRRHRVHARLGCGSYVEYLERLFGYPPRLAREKLRVADALVDLPRLRAALADGELSWSAVREVSRVAVPETCAEWIAAARGRTVREVEERVSGRKPGDRPGDPADPRERRHVLRLEITSGTLAAFRDARRRLEDDAGHGLDDDELVRQLAHHVLGGPSDVGRAAYQIAMNLCERCGHASRDGAGREHPVAAHHAEAAACDAQVVPATHVGRATQTIPPRIRRAVWRRDHGRCQAPGCRAARFLEVHHIVPRARGGTHEPAGLVLLCSAHHARAHDGSFVVRGRAPDELVFEWRDGAPGATVSPGEGPERLAVSPAAPGVSPTAEEPVRPTGFDEQDGGSPESSSTEAPELAILARDSEATFAPGSRVGPQLAVDAVGALRRLGVEAAHARSAVADALGDGPQDIEALLRGALTILYERVYAARLGSASRGAAPG